MVKYRINALTDVPDYLRLTTRRTGMGSIPWT